MKGTFTAVQIARFAGLNERYHLNLLNVSVMIASSQ